ncbi:efflux transporter outer membrane subunit [Massilia sp. TWR1-2-2]|uniref:efflux transporter outer membrane subunit n=1 Tax=Massilia sp. TWR1-2-2 TaxID=2804584 RepID=UPI003CF25212
MIISLRRIFLLMITTAAGGCVVGPDYHRPALDGPAHWSAAPENSTSSLPAPARWWLSFNDTELNSLIERAVQDNPDIQGAEARVAAARANFDIASTLRRPTVSATGSYRRGRESENVPSTTTAADARKSENLFHAGFDARWELDLFGGVRRSAELANANYHGALHDRGGVILSLRAEVTRNYILLRASQQELAFTRASLLVQQDSLHLIKVRYQGGMATDLEVASAESQVNAIASRTPSLENAYEQSLYRLGILLGLAPGALSEELRAPGAIPAGPSTLPSGMPSDLLRQRPDILRAERQLAAATARIGVATADLYPKFSLLGALGLESRSGGDFFNVGSKSWSIGPSITWPIFQRGRIVANIEVRNAEQQEALINYRKSILVAYEEAENAIAAFRNEGHHRRAISKTVDSDERAVVLATSLYKSGLTDFRNVLLAEQTLFRSRIDLARSDAAVATALVALHKALGGGVEQDPVPANINFQYQQLPCQSARSEGAPKCYAWP